jgi:hypothetical protein
MWDDQWHLHGHTYSLDVEKLWSQGTPSTTTRPLSLYPVPLTWEAWNVCPCGCVVQG